MSTATHASHPSAGAGAVLILAFTGIVASSMQTLLIPVIADLPRLLDTSPGNASWLISSTLLTASVAPPIMGRLGDLHGKRRMMLISLAVMIAGALLSASTTNLALAVAGRALQGVAMSAIPLAIGLMKDILPTNRLDSAAAVMSTSMGVGSSLALPAAALVAQQSDWQVLFYGAAALGVLSVLLLLLVPETPARARGTFDIPGAVGLVVGLTLLLLPLSKGSEWGWTSVRTTMLFGGAVVVLALWAGLEGKLTSPLVDVRSFRRPVLLFTHLATMTVGASYLVVALVLPQLLQLPRATGYGLGQSMVAAGLLMVPLGLTMLLTAPLHARLSARYGPKATLLLGLSITAGGYGAAVGLVAAPWQTVIVTVVLGVGIGLAYASPPALLLGAVAPHETGAANGLNTLMRSVGAAVCSALVSVVLASTTRDYQGSPVPSLEGFRTAYLIAAALMGVGFVLALLLPKQGRLPHLRATAVTSGSLGRRPSRESADQCGAPAGG
ncbi:MFS transporter [Streptomyces parvulus]|uniref:MFS transporter n=1 Tax=Streptomyces parvulus TaxID=146923 RepID=UPI00343F14D6